MTDKVQKIREEVEKRYEYWKEKESNSHSIESEIRMSECHHLLLMFDSLQEEPVKEELEEAANNALNNVLNTHEIVNVRSCLEMFRFGANWKKEQMMAKAVDGYVIEDIEEGNGDFLLSAEYLPKSMGLKDRQKVKVIAIKEED